MGKFSCLIVEDEPLAMERTMDFVLKIPFLNLLTTYDNALEALAFLKSNEVDILFLDIKMDELSGIELLESSNIDSQIIFTTAYTEYALKGYELNVTDYLLKPFTFNRFLQAVNKAHEQLLLENKSEDQDFFFVKTENKLVKLFFEDILYIEGMRDYRRIFLEDKSIMTLQTFTELEQIIPTKKVSRVHKSYMVSIPKIESIEKNKIRIKKKIIPISATYKKIFFDLIKSET